MRSRGQRCAPASTTSFWYESLCLNSGRIGGAARGRVPRAPARQAMGVCKRAASHRASGVRTLGIPQAKPAIFLTAQSQHPTLSCTMHVTSDDA